MISRENLYDMRHFYVGFAQTANLKSCSCGEVLRGHILAEMEYTLVTRDRLIFLLEGSEI